MTEPTAFMEFILATIRGTAEIFILKSNGRYKTCLVPVVEQSIPTYKMGMKQSRKANTVLQSSVLQNSVVTNKIEYMEVRGRAQKLGQNCNLKTCVHHLWKCKY